MWLLEQNLASIKNIYMSIFIITYNEFAEVWVRVPYVLNGSGSMSDLKVFVIEEHTEALEVLSLAARRRLIKIKDCTFVHLDSHPDLSCFENIGPEHIKDRAELCHRLRNSEDGISSFILPSLAMGLLDSVIWIKPPWTDQIPTGDHLNMSFGWKSPTHGGQMAMATDLPYWLDDGNAVSDVGELSHVASFDLRVQSVETWLAQTLAIKSTPPHGTSFHRGAWVLDICLDYFSCANPLQEPDLSEHISTAAEIEQMLATLRQGLLGLRGQSSIGPPSLCIIARSEQDGFTPGEVAANLEDAVQALLVEVYGETQIYHINSFEKFYDTDFIRSV